MAGLERMTIVSVVKRLTQSRHTAIKYLHSIYILHQLIAIIFDILIVIHDGVQPMRDGDDCTTFKFRSDRRLYQIISF